MVERLAEDHENSRRLAEGIASIPGIAIDPQTIQTDIVIFGVTSEHITAAQLAAALLEHGVQVGSIGSGQIRAVTHYGIDSADIETTIKAIGEVMEHAA